MAIRRLRNGNFGNSPSILIVGRLAATMLSVVSAPIIARAIGPEGRGETAAALALFLIIPVVIGLGMPMEVRRLVAISDELAALKSARLVTAASSLVAIGLAVACYFTVFDSFDSFARTSAAVGIGLSAIPASWALDVSALMAQERFGAVALLQIIQPATYVTLVLAFWLFEVASVATVIIAFICGNVANFIAGLALTNASLFKQRSSFRPLLARSFDYYGGSVSQIASTRLDQVIALPLIGAAQAGYYSVAVTIGSSAPLVLGHALGGSIFRRIARSRSDERVELEAAAVRSAVALALMFCPLIALASWPLMPIIFGSEFGAALPATLVAIGAGGIQLVAFVASAATTARGRGKLLTWAQCAGLASGVIALLIAGPIAGAVGAAIASALGFATTVLILAGSLKVKPLRLVPRTSDFPESIRQLLRH